jgi:hypothetical protein
MRCAPDTAGVTRGAVTFVTGDWNANVATDALTLSLFLQILWMFDILWVA